MNQGKFVELLREQQRQIAALDHLVNQMQHNEKVGYSKADENRMHALADLLFAANESLITGYYKLKDDAVT